MKKAEIQMQETILVTFVVTIIIVLGLFFFYKINQNSLDKEVLEYEQLQVYALLSTLQNHAQVQYSYLGNSENSIDTAKLLNTKLNDLGEKEITIKQIYPRTDNKKCSPGNYPNCNSYLIYSKHTKENVNIISTPVSLYFPSTNEYKLGLLEIKWYY